MAVIKQILKAVPVIVVGAAVPVLIFAMSVPPDQAKATLQKWVQSLGFSDAPSWMADTHTIHLIIGYSSAFAVVYSILIWGIIPYFRKRRAIPFEIIFDLRNPGHQFWSAKVVETFSERISGVEYWIKVWNRTDKTIYGIKAVAENPGQMGYRPVPLQFDQTEEPALTLNPGDSAFIRLFFAALPVMKAGMLTRESTALYGPIVIRVSATDTAAVERIFQYTPLAIGFDAFKQSMIFPISKTVLSTPKHGR